MFSETDLETMQWVRHAFNPKELANPGKVFPTPRTCGEGAHFHPSGGLDEGDRF
jgi:glycolate oxidase